MIPVIILVLYQWMTHSLYGHGLLGDAASYAIERSWTVDSKFLLNALIALAFSGGCILTVLTYSPLLWSGDVLRYGIFATIVFIVIFSYFKKIDQFSIRDANGAKLGFLILFGLMVAGGVGLLALAIVDFWKRRNSDSLLLLLWVLGTFFFAGLVNWTVNARSILPMVPAAGILFARQIDRRKVSMQEQSNFRWVWPLVPAAIVALSLSWADYNLAGASKTAATIVHDKFAKSGSKVWFAGHWGFQYYMQEKHYEPLDLKNSKLSIGDIVIVPMNNNNLIYFSEDTAIRRDIFQISPNRWLTTQNLFTGAGFYSSLAGPLPFSVGRVPPDQYHVLVMTIPILLGK